jgi:type I restriction enzyme S subunit
VVGRHNAALTGGPTIIIGRKGTVGAVHFSPRPCWPIDTTYFIDDFRGLNPVYVTHALRSLNLAELDTSTTIPGLNRDDLYAQEIPVAPITEQKRIVAKINELLTQVNAARDRLAKLPTILKRFRQSVLAAACSGRLTEDWRTGRKLEGIAGKLLADILSKRTVRMREIGSGAYKAPLQPDSSQLPDVPEEWAIASVDQLTYLVTSGSRGWGKYYSESGPLFIRAQDISTDNLVVGGVAHVQPPKNAEGSRTRVKCGDLLVTITGANVTKSARVDVDPGEAYVSQHVALVRPVDASVREFLYLWIISPQHGRAKLLEDAYGAGKPGLNLDNIRELIVALPPPEEQHEIVRRVEALFKLADAIEKRVEAATKRADKLTQAILGKAFRGDLVPTEAVLARAEGRDYETAQQLLERIASLKTEPRKASRKPQQDRNRLDGTLGIGQSVTMRTHNKESVLAAVAKMKSTEFSFDDLREAVPGDYESLKEVVFELLQESDPTLTQRFDEGTREMKLVRRLK